MAAIWAATALLPAGWAADVRIDIDAGRIAAVTPGAAPEGHRAAILLPAPANLHSHAFQRAMAGLAEARGPALRDTFWTWRETMYRFLERLTPDDIEAIAAFAQMEMLEAGYAAVAEFHYLHHAAGGAPYADPAEMALRVLAAAEETGIGLTLLPVLYRQGGLDGRALAGGQLRFGTDRDQFARIVEGAEAALDGDARVGVAAHSLRAVTAGDLAFAAALRPGAPMHIHVAEQAAEVDEVRAATGARPVEWLLGAADVGPRWCLVHATQMVPAETEALARTGAVTGLCPVTEANLGDGIFDGARYLEAGGRFGIGTDSNVRIGLAEELRTLEYGQRLRDRARTVLAAPSTGRTLFDAASAGGARAAGRDGGRIAPGASADLVALDADTPDLAGLAGDAILDAWVFATPGSAVRDVWSAGRHVVTEGRHVARDALAARYAAVARRLRA